MKSKIKKIVALLCATVLVATTFFGHWYTRQAEAATDAEPIFLDGYENLTIKDFKDADDTSVALTPGTGTSTGYKRYKTTDYTSFEKVLLSMKVTFAGGTYATRLDVAGGASSGYYTGLQIYPSNATGDELWVVSEPVDGNGFYAMTDERQSFAITPAEAGVNKFVGEEFILQIAFDFGEEVSGKADLTLDVYINGKLAKSHTFTGCNTAKFGSYLNFVNGASITYDNVIPPIEPVFLDGYENLTIKDFEDSAGIALTPGTLQAGGGYKAYAAQNCTSFEKVLLSMKVTFGGGSWSTKMEVAGTGSWSGIQIQPSNAAGDELYIISAAEDSNGNYGTTDAAQSFAITPTEAGVNKFVGEEMILQLAFDFGEEVSGKADLTLDVYINGKLAKSRTFTGCNMAKFGNYLNFYSASSGSAITYDNVIAPIKPVSLNGYENLTIKDFKDADDTSVALTPGTGTSTGYKRYKTTDYTSFEKVLLSMKVTFASGTYATRLDIAGGSDNGGYYSGLWLFPDAEGNNLTVRSCPLDPTFYGTTDGYQEFSITTAEADVNKFVGEEFVLQIAFDFGETDSSTNKADLTLDVYINGKLAKSHTFTGCNMAKFGNYLNFVNGVNITYDNVIAPTTPDTPDQSGDIDLNDYEEVTIKDFINASGKVMAEKAYMCLDPTSGTFDGFNLANHDSFDGKVLSMNVKFKEGGAITRIDVAGTTKWKGLQVYASSTGDKLTILSSMADAWGSYGMTDANQAFDIAVADAKDVSNFVNTQFLLQLAFDFGEVDSSNNKADLTLYAYINGESCGSHTFTGCNMGVFGNYMGLYRQSDESTIIVGSVGAEFPTDPGIQPSGRYEKVTYTQFGIVDGEYTDVKGALKDETSVAGHVLCGDIQLKITGAQYTQIVLGGKEEYDGWSGIRLLTNTSDYFNVMWYDDRVNGSYVTQLTPSVAHVDFNGEEFNLMMSTEVVEHDNDGNADDIKLGIWFNGVLYNNSYIYIDNKGPSLGNYFLVSSEQAFLNADPELGKLPNKNFDKVTFSDFGLESDVCTQAEGMVKATAKEYPTLDKVVFSGDFRLSDTGSYQIIYGGNSDWNGFRMIVNSNGTATLGWYRYNSETETDDTQISAIINPTDVGLTSFTKETFNFKISTELVDYDEDGEVNDIKLAIWFNDVLYPINGNEYSVVTDWDDTLKNHFSIYQATAGTNVLLRNDAEYQANPYYYEDIASFRQDTGYTYPTLEGYVFAGWYEDEAYTTWIETDVKSGDAWAKFVEKDVLSVKPQVMLDKESNNVPTDKTNLRFVTTVDNLNYSRISFYIEKEGGTGRKDAVDLGDNPRLVYERLYAIGSNSTIIEYKPSVFSWQSEYFKAFTVEDIPETAYGTMWTVTPYWVTMDGTTVPGTVLETCVDDYKTPGTNTSKAVSIDFLGEDVMPITGFFGPYTVSDANDPKLIPNYISDTYFKAIADMGVNLIVSSNDDYKTLPNSIKKQLELGGKYGIGIFVKDTSIKGMSESDMLAQIANYKNNYKAFAGMHLVDEPGTDDYCSTSKNGKVSDYSDLATNLNDNNIMFYGNMYPVLNVASNWWEGDFGSVIGDADKEAYINYLDAYYKALNPKVLSYDFYPFSDTRMNAGASGNEKYNLDLYFWNLSTIRDKAQSTGKPFWAFVQAGSQWNDTEGYFDSNTPYYPDEAQFNWSAHTALAFGAQGIQYFPLVQPKHFANAGTSAADKMWDFERNGLIGAAGNKTEWYFYAQELNKHIAAIDNVLMNASSDKIIALGSTAQADTNGLTDVVKTTSYTNPVSGNVVINNVTATGNALIGCFDYCGKTALYVVNYDFSNTGDVTLTFNGEKEITKIENAETTETTTTSMTLNMEAGEGILLVIE